MGRGSLAQTGPQSHGAGAVAEGRNLRDGTGGTVTGRGGEEEDPLRGRRRSWRWGKRKPEGTESGIPARARVASEGVNNHRVIKGSSKGRIWADRWV